MKTAQDILNEYLPKGFMLTTEMNSAVLKAINKARKETVEECAENATADSIGYDGHPFVKKESILNLISQIK